MAEAVKRGPGRPRKDTPPPVDYPPLTTEDIIKTVCHVVNSKGQPDLLNYMPLRMIPHAEAAARGWVYFYDARACRRGHQAPHFTNNVNHCVDCKRTREDGKQPIGGRTGGMMPDKSAPYVKKDVPAGTAGASALVAPRPPECDRLEKQFLTAYAETKDFSAAAEKCRVSAPAMQARMSYSPLFKAAIADLENTAGLAHVPAADLEFAWDADKVKQLLTAYIDTGDIETARNSIGVTPSQFHKELRDNYEFSTLFAEAEALAKQILRERATKMALAGDTRLIPLVLKAELPDKFGDKLNLNMSGEVRSTDGQLLDTIVKLILAGRRRIEGRIIDTEPLGAIAAPEDTGGAGEEGEPQSVDDLL